MEEFATVSVGEAAWCVVGEARSASPTHGLLSIAVTPPGQQGSAQGGSLRHTDALLTLGDMYLELWSERTPVLHVPSAAAALGHAPSGSGSLFVISAARVGDFVGDFVCFGLTCDAPAGRHELLLRALATHAVLVEASVPLDECDSVTIAPSLENAPSDW